ncbi:MAG TPA: MotA/TolQ/ExbB proton channel family protein [Steroidobacteraceae bacterium]|jgi:biopolymer transport protein ExbB|nr:MotA/TolQ/ExbB proton channel family protein [Steroidobacteraceae bacterium]
MKYDLFHDITFDALYTCIAVLFFVILERGIYLSYLGWRMQRLAQIIDRTDKSVSHDIRALKWTDPASRAMERYAQVIAQGATRERQEDYSSALFIGFDKKVSGRLWILDTIVTAAPLLGLLGTIFGIMETFNSLAAGGVSDSAAVSRGIGTALIATAIGIATALLGLVGNNVLSRRAHVLTEDFKALLLSLTAEAEGESTQTQGYAALPTALRPRGISPR